MYLPPIILLSIHLSSSICISRILRWTQPIFFPAGQPTYLLIYPNLPFYLESFFEPSLPSLPADQPIYLFIYPYLSILSRILRWTQQIFSPSWSTYLFIYPNQSIYLESPSEPSLPSLPAGQHEARRIKQPGKVLLFLNGDHSWWPSLVLSLIHWSVVLLEV